MKLRMHENSLFAVLLRSPWWVSLLAALAVFGLIRLVLAPLYAAFAALPLLVVAAVAGWRQLRAPSAERIAQSLDALRSMNWDEFSALIEAGLRREGYAVERLGGAQADFELTRAGRTSLVACKRWKAARTGVEPLRELRAAGEAREAGECVYVLAGELSEQARRFAGENRIRIVEGAELARLAKRA